MNAITVFCGSSPGYDPLLMDSAFQLGQAVAKASLELVYGGANVGLMGAVANGALSAGGRVIGVLPLFLQDKEIAHTGLSELIWVDSMHQRKMKMHELSDGVITLPGGFGTLEEYFEMLTWGQLGLHKKPVALLNVNGFFDGLFALADAMVSNGLLKSVNRDMMLVSTSIPDLLAQLISYEPPRVGKWLNIEKT